jgi:hypothetical protein
MNFQLSNSDWQEGSQQGATSAMVDGTATTSDNHPGLSKEQFLEWHEEIKQQPAWRAKADREADYCDGNQLDSDVLNKQAAIGMPPAIEPLIGSVIDSVLGMEAQHRSDWRVIPDSDKDGEDVAEALNYKLNQAERHAKADKACSEAFAGQSKVGIGWVEVSRDPNPFNYPYRCKVIPRNEIYWDWRGSFDPAATDHRYLIRRKWTDKAQAKLLFPQQAQLIEAAAGGWAGYDNNLTLDGGTSTGLSNSGGGMPTASAAVTTPLPGDSGTSYPMLSAHYTTDRGATLEEQEWRDVTNNRICLFEVWYREWIRALVMKMPDGRVVEYNKNNEIHTLAVATGAATPEYAIITKVRLSWWLGHHRLVDMPTPYRHNKFPYVPFWGKREDRTGVPFGLIRGMMYLQDNINATTSKIRWGLSAVRTTRTEGATVDDDDTVRTEISRPDADIVLTKEFTRDGHVFKVERDFELNEQQYKMMTDAREGIKRVGGVYNSFMGQDGQAKSGVAISNLAEQSTQSLADLYDNFRTGRSEVGELLLSLIVDDMIGKPEQVVIKGNAIKPDKTINLNVKMQDQETGLVFLDNDIERTTLKVDLEEIPSTPSFKAQQLNSFSEVFKAAPEEFQRALFPQLLSLMDVPNRQDAIKAVREAMTQQSPEQIQQQIDQAVQDALNKANVESKGRELDLKEKLNDATIKNMVANAVKTGTEAQYAAMQAAQVIASMPTVAPIADKVMEVAGYQLVNPAETIPGYTPQNYIAPASAEVGNVPAPTNHNTDPVMPPIAPMPQSAGTGEMHGIETQRSDGIQHFSSGGAVNGAGTTTSDSVPIMASKGEGVLNAEAMALLGEDKLNQLNYMGLQLRQAQHLADGGMVQSIKDGIAKIFTGGAGAVVDNARQQAQQAATPAPINSLNNALTGGIPKQQENSK